MNKLNLHKDVYSPNSIDETCLVYKDFAKISIKRNDPYIELLFSDCRYDLERTIKEFENYLINVENSNK